MKNYIYLDGNKIELTDEQAERINRFYADLERDVKNKDVCDFLCKKSDYKKVVRGEWQKNYHGMSWICSECHENPTQGMGYVQSHRSLYDFCPHCGADMRGDNK